jgi:hypothetical protein
MIKKILIPLLILIFSCNAPNPKANTAKPKSHSKHKSVASKPLPGTWNVMAYPGAQGGQTARKYVKAETEGSFSNSTTANNYLNADIIVDKVNAGILLHQFKKSSPAEKFTGPVHINIKDAAGNVLKMTSSRGWNKSGGILIERNNNDYSRFRIFMLQSEAVINVEIRDDSSSVYNFDINTTGFADAFGQI